MYYTMLRTVIVLRVKAFYFSIFLSKNFLKKKNETACVSRVAIY